MRQMGSRVARDCIFGKIVRITGLQIIDSINSSLKSLHIVSFKVSHLFPNH